MARLTIIPLSDSDAAARWAALHDHSPQYSAFSTLAYANALTDAFDLSCDIVLSEQPSSEESAGLLAFHRKKGPFRQLIVPPFTAYNGPVSRSPYLAEAFVPNLMSTLALRYDDLRLHFHPSLFRDEQTSWNSWPQQILNTYYINLEDVDSAFSDWSAGTRRTYRKNTDDFLFTEDPSAASAVIGLCQASYARHGRPLPAQREQLERLVCDLQEQDLVRIFVVRPSREQETSAGLILLHAGHEAFYWIAGSVPGASMTVLIGQLLLLLKREGFNNFDFVGANTPSIAEFKRRFGATLTPYQAVSHSPNRIVALIKSLKQLIS